MTAPARDMLVAAPDRWDEACFAVPALRALIASGLGIGVICRETQAAFWQTLPGLEILAFPAKAKTRTAAATIGNGWKSSLVWEPGFAADSTRAAGIAQRLGPGHPKLKKHLTQTLSFSTDPLDHRVRFYLAAIEELGVPTRQPGFFAPADLGVAAQPGTVLLCPDSDFGPSHLWPADRWQALAGQLIENGHSLHIASLNGGPATRLAETLGDRATRHELGNLGEALPLLASHPLTIAADGSLPHLASHAGSTCVTLFGPNDPSWKRPLGTRHRIVSRHAECAPCLQPKCPLDHRCQTELDLAHVRHALTELGFQWCALSSE